jgi:DNA-binding NarL/FixJ family response regulator
MKATHVDVRLCYYSHTRGWIPVKQGLDSLSKRELEVMKLFALGDTAKDIARKLFLSTKTVMTYKERIFEKLSVTSIPELIHYALHHNAVKNLNESKVRSNVLHLPRARAAV